MFSSLGEINNETRANWGKMSPQHMIEHLADFFDVSSGRLVFELVTPAEHLPKYRDFLMSEKVFRENTKAPASILGDEPRPLRHPDVPSATNTLLEAVNRFFDYFEDPNAAPTVHPVFGALNFDDWVRLHFKHVTHHLRQFGLKSYV